MSPLARMVPARVGSAAIPRRMPAVGAESLDYTFPEEPEIDPTARHLKTFTERRA